MKFNELVKYILNEGGVDPMKFAYKGAPQGFRKDTGISNPETFVPTSPSRKMYDVASAPQETRAKSGEYIATDVHKMIRTALLVTASDPEAGAELKRVLEQVGEVYFSYKNNLQEIKNLEDRISKLPNPNSDLALELKERLKEYIKLTQQSKEKLLSMTPDVFNAVQDLVREGGQSFIKALKAGRDVEEKSLDALESEVQDEDEKKAIKFLSDMWRGKSDFEPVVKFVEVEKQEGKNPIPRLLTIYKTVIDTMVKNNLVGSPERTFNFITGQTNKIRALKEPTAGRTSMKKRDTSLANAIAFIKKGRFKDAKEAVNSTKLSNEDKADLMINIDKLSRGEMTEADVIRPLYAF
jgi:hypothetical protein